MPRIVNFAFVPSTPDGFFIHGTWRWHVRDGLTLPEVRCMCGRSFYVAHPVRRDGLILSAGGRGYVCPEHCRDGLWRLLGYKLPAC